MSLLALLAVATGPVYLSCALQQEQPLPVQIMADEEHGRATVTIPSTGRVVVRTAVFNERTLTIPDDPVIWKVDRVTLAIRRHMLGNEEKNTDEQGKCTIAKPPADRAF